MRVVDSFNDRMNVRSLVELRMAVMLFAIISLLPAWYNFGIAARDATTLYIPTARLFALGDFCGGFSQSHPLFALLIYIFSALTGLDFEVSGRFVAGFNFVLASLAIFEITYKLSLDRLTALVATVLLAINPELVQRSVDCLKESLIIALVLWGNYFILFSTAKKSRVILGLILLAMALPLRSTVLFFIIGWLIVWMWYKPERRALRSGAIALAIMFTGSMVILNQDSTFLCANDFCFAPIAEYLKQIDISRLAFVVKILAEFVATGGYMAVVAGIFGYAKVNSKAWQISMSCVLICVFTVIFMLGWISDRFLLLPLAWFYPAAAVGLVSWLRDSRKVVCALAIITLVSLPLIWSYKTFRDPNPVMVNQKVAGLWIKDQFGPGKGLYSNRDRLLFYADAQAVDKPTDLAAVDMHHVEDAAQFVGQATSSGLVPVKSIGDIVIYQRKPAGSSRDGR